MANVWYGGIQQIYAKCWLTPPAAVTGLNDNIGTGIKDTTCPKIPGNAIGPVLTQVGSGSDDGDYVYV
jgi:hypothetical protein